MMYIKQSLEKLSNWLLFSGIQNKDDKVAGFNAWYDMDSRSYPYIYSEITGYGITSLLYLNEFWQDDHYLNRAKAAANWIIESALTDCGGVLTRDYLDEKLNNEDYSFSSQIIYAFDSAMVLFGVANLFKKTKEEKYLKVAKKIGNFLLTMERADGLFEPIYNARTGEFKNTNEKWSTQRGSFHAKLALGLLSLYDIVHDIRFKNSAIRICSAVLNFQNSDGRFITFRDSGATHMHPHTYTCEGLYYAGKKLKNKDFLVASLKGTIWALNHQLPTGGMPCIFSDDFGFNVNERTDVSAQILRMAVYFSGDKLSVMRKYTENINKLANRLLELQQVDDISGGGFFYGFTEDGKEPNHINSWCSMFAVEALGNFYKYKNKEKISPKYLI